MYLTANHPVVIRALSRLLALPRNHHVRRIGIHRYEVVSGRTGSVYAIDTKHLTCECEAARLGRMCDHRVAALSFERALNQLSSPSSNPANTTTNPTRPATVSPAAWRRLGSDERELVVAGRLSVKANSSGRIVERILDGYTI